MTNREENQIGLSTNSHLVFLLSHRIQMGVARNRLIIRLLAKKKPKIPIRIAEIRTEIQINPILLALKNLSRTVRAF